VMRGGGCVWNTLWVLDMGMVECMTTFSVQSANTDESTWH